MITVQTINEELHCKDYITLHYNMTYISNSHESLAFTKKHAHKNSQQNNRIKDRPVLVPFFELPQDPSC